jgi:hypothetical protein
MLSIHQIHNIAYSDELQKRSSPIYIWVTGPFAAGKTFFIEHLTNELVKLGKVSTFRDDAQLIEEVNFDANSEHHIKINGGFIVTDNVIHDRILVNICSEAEKFDGDFFLIELARAGRDLQGIRDMSYYRISKFITRKILDNSIFIRIECPYEERLRRNEHRKHDRVDGKYRKATLDIMQRFAPEDDFYEWIKGISRPIIVLNNS